MPFVVRSARMGDLETLVSCTLAEAVEAEDRAQPAETVRAGIRAGLEDPGVSTYWVLESEGGDVVGSASIVREWSDWHAANYWWVQSMFVQPGWRGKGLSALLLDEIVRQADAAGAIEVRLYVQQDNERAIAAYRRYGFEDAPYLVMRKSL
jgi:GNAT superfamily N-acetyltransferase